MSDNSSCIKSLFFFFRFDGKTQCFLQLPVAMRSTFFCFGRGEHLTFIATFCCHADCWLNLWKPKDGENSELRQRREQYLLVRLKANLTKYIFKDFVERKLWETIEYTLFCMFLLNKNNVSCIFCILRAPVK